MKPIDNLKEHTYLANTHNVLYERIREVIKLTLNFVKERKLILYGGTAIDFALRAKGSLLYPDFEGYIPDIDVYSPQHTEDSYDLVDILGRLGFKEARTIRGIFSGIMKVDIGDNNFILDVSYKPREIFDKLPTMEYEGIKIIHPHFQCIDIHLALAFPFDNPPTEVIFNRWEKDNERYGLLTKYYPFPAIKYNNNNVDKTFSYNKENPLSGIAAYGILCEHWKTLYPKSTDYLHIDCTLSADKITVASDYLELCAHDYTKITGAKSYEPYINIYPAYKLLNDYKYYNTENTLISIVSVKDIKITCIQYLLYLFLGQYYIVGKDKYMAMYNSLIYFIKNNTKNDPAFLLSIDIYGNNNLSIAAQLQINDMLYLAKDPSAVPPLELNYYINKGPNSRPQKIDYSLYPIFRESGKEII